VPPRLAAVGNGLIERLETLESIRPMLGALRQVIEEPAVSGLPCVGILLAYPAAKVCSSESWL